MKNKKFKYKIQERLTDLLYQHFHFLLLGESLGALLYVAVLWSIVNHTILLVWLMCMLLINGLLRHLQVYYYHYYRKRNQIINIEFWRNVFIATTFFAGITWACGGLFFNLVPDNFYRFMIALFMIGVIGAANATFIPSKKAYMFFVLPIELSLLISLLLQNSMIYFALSGGLLVLMILSTKLAMDASKAMTSSLALQLKNKKILMDLAITKQKLEFLNQKLHAENTVRRDIEKHLLYLATHDYLTQLPNRKLFMEEAQQSLEVAQQQNDYLALIFLDIDFFKGINDNFGHEIGDQSLISITSCLENILPSNLTARFGGDEFCILLKDIKRKEEIEDILKKISNCFSKKSTINNFQISITASMGVSIFPSDGKTLSALLEHADTALYQAKATGRNKYVYYNDCIKS